MIPCPECQQPVSAHAEACLHCGRPRAALLEARLDEAARLEDTTRLCAIVMPLAALAALCVTRITGTSIDAVLLLGKNIVAGGVQLLGALLSTGLILAFFALPILVIVLIARAALRCLPNR